MKKLKYKTIEYNKRNKKRILRDIIDSDKKFITTYKEIKNYSLAAKTKNGFDDYMKFSLSI